MKRLLSFAGLIVGVLLIADFAVANDFYAYYTRLDYEIPLELAIDYIPQELEEEEFEEDKEFEEGEEFEEEEEEEWLDSGPITGKYADIVVNVAPGRQLVFSRESSYLP